MRKEPPELSTAALPSDGASSQVRSWGSGLRIRAYEQLGLSVAYILFPITLITVATSFGSVTCTGPRSEVLHLLNFLSGRPPGMGI